MLFFFKACVFSYLSILFKSSFSLFFFWYPSCVVYPISSRQFNKGTPSSIVSGAFFDESPSILKDRFIPISGYRGNVESNATSRLLMSSFCHLKKQKLPKKKTESSMNFLQNRTLWPRYLYEFYDSPDDATLETFQNKEMQVLNMVLYIVVMDAGSTKTHADLWTTVVTYGPSTLPYVNLSSMKIVASLGKTQDFRTFYTELLASKGKRSLIRATASLLSPIFRNARSEIKSRVETSADPDLVIPHIPIIVHSTAGLRDINAAGRQELFRAIEFVVNGAFEGDERYEQLFSGYRMKKNVYNLDTWQNPLQTTMELTFRVNPFKKKSKMMRFFTTSRYCRAITGMEEAVFTFLTANMASGTIQKMQKNIEAKRELGGILEVGGASMQVVFAVENQITDGPLGTLNLIKNDRFLRRDLFPPQLDEFNVFGTSYMNLGINRALALLLKQHCQRLKRKDQICFFPCFNKGWKQTCIPGVPRPRAKPCSPSKGSPLEQDENGRVLMDKNFLLDIAQFCHKSNPRLKNIIPRSNCLRTGFMLNGSTVEAEATIHHCTEIRGTGNVTECHNIILDYLFSNELPGNYESISETGAASPVEIGQFMRPKGLLYVVGNSLVIATSRLKKWKILKSEYYNDGSGQIRRCDLTYLMDAANIYCYAHLSPSHTFVNPVTLRTIQVDETNYDYCYRIVYALALFKSLNIKIGDVQVQFEAHIKHVENDQTIDFGWKYGALTHLIQKSNFVSDLFALGPKFYRSAYRPLQSFLHEGMESFVRETTQMVLSKKNNTNTLENR